MSPKPSLTHKSTYVCTYMYVSTYICKHVWVCASTFTALRLSVWQIKSILLDEFLFSFGKVNSFYWHSKIKCTTSIWKYCVALVLSTNTCIFAFILHLHLLKIERLSRDHWVGIWKWHLRQFEVEFIANGWLLTLTCNLSLNSWGYVYKGGTKGHNFKP